MLVAAGRAMLVRLLHFQKAWFPMLVAIGRAMLVRLVQFLKALSLMLVACRIATACSEVFS